MPTQITFNANITINAPDDVTATNLVAYLAKNSPQFNVVRENLLITITIPENPWMLPDPPY